MAEPKAYWHTNLHWVVSILWTAVSLTACGGGHGIGNQDASGGGNAGGGNVTPQSSMRIARMQFDFDNNGIFEGNAVFSYYGNGRVRGQRYSYTDDGVVDTDIQFFQLNSVSGYTVAYSYNDAGLLDITTFDQNDAQISKAYIYDTNGMLTRIDVLLRDASDALVNSWYWSYTLTGSRLDGYSLFLTSSPTPIHIYTLSYNSAGQVESDHLTENATNRNFQTYTWRTDGKIERIYLVDGGGTLNLTEYTYDDAGRLFSTQGTSAYPRPPYRWNLDYDNNEIHIDMGDDGSVEAVIRIEWENAPCQRVFMWNTRGEPNFVADTTVPYQPGTGYSVIPLCGE